MSPRGERRRGDGDPAGHRDEARERRQEGPRGTGVVGDQVVHRDLGVGAVAATPVPPGVSAERAVGALGDGDGVDAQGGRVLEQGTGVAQRTLTTSRPSFVDGPDRLGVRCVRASHREVVRGRSRGPQRGGGQAHGVERTDRLVAERAVDAGCGGVEGRDDGSALTCCVQQCGHHRSHEPAAAVLRPDGDPADPGGGHADAAEPGLVRAVESGGDDPAAVLDAPPALARGVHRDRRVGRVPGSERLTELALHLLGVVLGERTDGGAHGSIVPGRGHGRVSYLGLPGPELRPRVGSAVSVMSTLRSGR